ncbi:MAG: glycosyltransferase family 39 protein [Candidatus Omnitrophica bacterium]|nr:glycosyltransferase family 39 protein [Candidatus Omnitrophota bacterium]
MLRIVKNRAIELLPITVVVLLGLFVRTVWLDQTVMLRDEGSFFSDILNTLKYHQSSFVWTASELPPIYVWINIIWLKIVGISELKYRLLSVLFGTINIALSYKFLLHWGRKKVSAIAGAGIFALAPFIWSIDRWWHGEALHLTLIYVCLFLWLAAAKSKKNTRIIALGIYTAALSIYVKLNLGPIMVIVFVASCFSREIQFKKGILYLFSILISAILFCIWSYPYAMIWAIGSLSIASAQSSHPLIDTVALLGRSIHLIFSSAVLSMFIFMAWPVLRDRLRNSKTIIFHVVLWAGLFLFLLGRAAPYYLYLYTPFILMELTFLFDHFLDRKCMKSNLQKLIFYGVCIAVIAGSWWTQTKNYYRFYNAQVDLHKVYDVIQQNRHSENSPVHIAESNQLAYFFGFSDIGSIYLNESESSVPMSEFYFNSTDFNLFEQSIAGKRKILVDFLQSGKKLTHSTLRELQDKLHAIDHFRNRVATGIFDEFSKIPKGALVVLLPENLPLPTVEKDFPQGMGEMEKNLLKISKSIKIIDRIYSIDKSSYAIVAEKID